MDFKVFLVIPPDYEHDVPPLGTPALAGFLKKRGIDAVQRDLNLAYRDFLIEKMSSPALLDFDAKKILLKPALKKFFADCLKSRYYSDLLPRTNDGIFPGLPYDNNTNSSFYFGERLLSSEHLWRYLEDGGENTFLQFYLDAGILDNLKNTGANLLGISITSPSQAIASLTLGLLVKRNLPHIHITIGGQWPTLYRTAIIQEKELFRCFDTMIVFEGESALYELVKALRDGGRIFGLPNLISKDTVNDVSAGRVEEDLNQLPCPDFDGLDLREYNLGSEGRIAATFETSRGCYWSKCAYCVDLPLPKPTHRRKNPVLVASDMKELSEKYGASYLMFGDPGLSPRQMREISIAILNSGVKIEWWTMARLDPGFDRELFDLAYRAGLRQVNFGFESANDRLCERLDKGNKRARSSRVIKDCAGSGINVDLQTMVGLPGESFEDGLDTLDFLGSHRELLYHVAFNTYYLTPGNYIFQNPSRYGIEYQAEKALPFQFFIPFKNTRGMDMDQAELLKIMHGSLFDKKTFQPTSPEPAPASVSLTINGDTSSISFVVNRAAGEIKIIDEE